MAMKMIPKQRKVGKDAGIGPRFRYNCFIPGIKNGWVRQSRSSFDWQHPICYHGRNLGEKNRQDSHWLKFNVPQSCCQALLTKLWLLRFIDEKTKAQRTLNSTSELDPRVEPALCLIPVSFSKCFELEEIGFEFGLRECSPEIEI